VPDPRDLGEGAGSSTLNMADALRLADELAVVKAMQSEPLGEMLVAASRVQEHIRALNLAAPVIKSPPAKQQRTSDRNGSLLSLLRSVIRF
jgi:hypothetical protein